MGVKMIGIMGFRIKMFDHMNNDIIMEIMLRVGGFDFKHFCIVNKKTYNLCDNVQFWQKKLKHDRLPTIIINTNRSLDTYVDCMGLKVGMNAFIQLYLKMQVMNEHAKKIVFISEVIGDLAKKEKMVIHLSDKYRKFKVNGIINTNKLPKRINYAKSFIEITKIDNNYKMKCYMFSKRAKKMRYISTMMERDQLIDGLTLFLFDTATIIVDVCYTDKNGMPLLPVDGCNPIRLSMWMMLKYQQKNNLFTL